MPRRCVVLGLALLLVRRRPPSRSLRLRAPRERAAGIALPVTVTGAAARTAGRDRAPHAARASGSGSRPWTPTRRARRRLELPTPNEDANLAPAGARRERAQHGRSGSTIRPVTLTSVGDINLGDGPGAVMAARGPRWPWTDVAPLLRAADIAFGNLECSVSNRGAPVVKQYTFRGRPSWLRTLRGYAGLDVVNLANNHVGDYGKAATGRHDPPRPRRRPGRRRRGLRRRRRAPPARRDPTRPARSRSSASPTSARTTSPPDRAGRHPPGLGREHPRRRPAARRLGDVVVATFHWGVERDAEALRRARSSSPARPWRPARPR